MFKEKVTSCPRTTSRGLSVGVSEVAGSLDSADKPRNIGADVRPNQLQGINPKIVFLMMIFLVFFMGIKSANSMESANKYWSVAVVTGPLSKNSNFKYYFEPQLRLIDNRYVFNQMLLLGGLGYQINPRMTLYLGPGWIITKTPLGNEEHENRYWEQLNWLLVNQSNLNIQSRTRLEERQDTKVSEMAIRFRERLWMRVPFQRSEHFSLSLFDEVFFNLNHPQWVSPHFFEQNRAFIGLSNQLSQSTIVDMGYLNQYLHALTNRLDHVLLLSFTVNL